jgi:hypothetical protein
MTDNTVVSFHASVVCIDVYIELSLVTLNVSLAFGPFDDISRAQAWADALEQIYAKKQLIESTHEEEALLGGNGLPLRPYLDVHMRVVMIAENKHARRLAKHLVSPDTPEKVESMLAEYAMRTANEATSYSCFLFDEGK